MKDETPSRDYLRNKFDELPIGNAENDWKKLNKALQLTMPIGLLSVAISWKLWLSKKMFWTGLLLISGSTAAVVIYQERHAVLASPAEVVKHGKKTAPAINALPPIVKPDPQKPKSALPVVAKVFIDTAAATKDIDTIRPRALSKRKHKTAIKQSANDSIARKAYVRKHKMSGILSATDTITRSIRKNKKSVKPDSLSRGVYPRKQKIPLHHAADSVYSVSKHKKLLPVLKDTTARRHKMPPVDRP